MQSAQGQAGLTEKATTVYHTVYHTVWHTVYHTVSPGGQRLWPDKKKAPRISAEPSSKGQNHKR
jgi:hypothetical protein